MQAALYFLLLLFFSTVQGISEEVPQNQCLNQEELVETIHEIRVGDQLISYKACVGSLLLKDKDCSPKANVFFTSYTKTNTTGANKRPVTFCFNGGPGSSSVWLHLGFAGPKRIYLQEDGTPPPPPYKLIENNYSLLDTTDLVFIDPVSTGYSRAIPEESAKCFHGVEEDVKAVSEFIRLYLTHFNRWQSPKFLMGESYGTTRAVGVAGYLHEEEFIDINGIILISTVLNFQSINSNTGNDLPYLLFLPSYTATALYHKKLPEAMLKDPAKTLQMACDFATQEYSVALFKGNLLPQEEKEAIIKKLAAFTGLSPEYVDRSNLRIDLPYFAKELLRSEKRTVGRFDSRVIGIDSDSAGGCFEYDPSMDLIAGAFTTSINEYLRNDLNYVKDTQYKILTDVFPWKYNVSNQYLNMTETLRSVMTKNPHLQVFVSSGYYDCATPFFATEYTFHHLGLDPSLASHVTLRNYEGGHMMYTNLSSLIQMKKDLSSFYQTTLGPNP